MRRSVIAGNSIRVGKRRKKRRVHDSEVIVFIEKGLLIDSSCLEVVDTLRVRELRSQSGVEESTVLADCLSLQIGRPQIRKRIATGVIVQMIPPDETAKRKDGCRANKPRPRRRQVESLNL